MRITGWTYYEDDRYQDMLDNWSALDGCCTHEEIKLLIAKELRKNQYRFDGGYHQNGDYGVPIFNSKWKYTCSFRTWGAIMAKAYPDEIDNSDGLGYVEWAWSVPEGKNANVPKK